MTSGSDGAVSPSDGVAVAVPLRVYALVVWCIDRRTWAVIGLSPRRETIVDLTERLVRFTDVRCRVLEVADGDDDAVEAAIGRLLPLSDDEAYGIPHPGDAE